jgi:hypothetical protein
LSFGVVSMWNAMGTPLVRLSFAPIGQTPRGTSNVPFFVSSNRIISSPNLLCVENFFRRSALAGYSAIAPYDNGAWLIIIFFKLATTPSEGRA